MARAWHPLCRDEYARLEHRLGANVVWRDEVAWRRVRPFFWRPVFPYEAFEPGTVRAPAWARLGGYQHLVKAPAQANATLQYIVFRDAHKYSVDTLGRSHRKHLRRGLEYFSIVQYGELATFIAEAWPVYLDFYRRTHYAYRRDRLRRSRFEEWARILLECPSVRVLGAYGEGGLSGIMIGVRVENCVIGVSTFAASAALPFYVSDVLLHALRQEAAVAGDVNIVWLGYVARKESLNRFKLERGAVIEARPAWWHLNPIVRWTIRLCWPRLLVHPAFSAGYEPRGDGSDVPEGRGDERDAIAKGPAG